VFSDDVVNVALEKATEDGSCAKGYLLVLIEYT